MDYVFLSDLYACKDEFLGKEVKVKGWIRNHRPQKEFDR